MIIGTTRELKNQEFRVGLTPDNVSAFVNGDWRTIYNHALKNNFRFLSYGDSSLLERE